MIPEIILNVLTSLSLMGNSDACNVNLNIKGMEGNAEAYLLRIKSGMQRDTIQTAAMVIFVGGKGRGKHQPRR